MAGHGAPTRLLLVRHGQSEWNAEGRWQGIADPPLSDLGRRQAASAAGASLTADAVVASDLQRAVETARIMADALGVATVEIEPDLRERDVGEFTGLTWAQIEQRWPGGLASTFVASPPGGETYEQVLARTCDALRRVAAAHAGHEVLVVTHGGIVRILERSHGIEPHPLPNLGGIRLEVEDGRLRLGDRLLLLDPDEAEVTVPRQL